MRIVAVVMIFAGLVIGKGAVMEVLFYGPQAKQFWVGVFTTPACAFLAVAGVVLWVRGLRARRMVLAAGIVMACATVAATALDVMGLQATVMGVVGAFAAMGWARSRRVMAT